MDKAYAGFFYLKVCTLRGRVVHKGLSFKHLTADIPVPVKFIYLKALFTSNDYFYHKSKLK